MKETASEGEEVEKEMGREQTRGLPEVALVLVLEEEEEEEEEV